LSNKFKKFFELFDQKLDVIGIQSYGISMTTLEEVFLRVGHGLEDEDKENSEDEKNPELSKRKSLKTKQKEMNADYNEREAAAFTSPKIWSQFKAILTRRIQVYRKNK
jgi:ATP-binding cassette subfamily A (ABC1) protein 3